MIWPQKQVECSTCGRYVMLLLRLYSRQYFVSILCDKYRVLSLRSKISLLSIEISIVPREFHEFCATDSSNRLKRYNHIGLKTHVFWLWTCSIVNIWTFMDSCSYTMTRKISNDSKSCLMHSWLDMFSKCKKLFAGTYIGKSGIKSFFGSIDEELSLRIFVSSSDNDADRSIRDAIFVGDSCIDFEKVTILQWSGIRNAMDKAIIYRQTKVCREAIISFEGSTYTMESQKPASYFLKFQSGNTSTSMITYELKKLSQILPCFGDSSDLLWCFINNLFHHVLLKK